MMEEVAQNNTAEGFDLIEQFINSEFWNDSLAVSLAGTLLVFTFVLFYLGKLYHNVARGLFPKAYVKRTKKVAVKEEKSAILQALTDVVPIEEEHRVMMDHDYDGIKELDNNLPPWWIYGFYFCILFALVYMTHFHIMGLGDLSEDEYKAEMIEARKEVLAFRATQKDFISVDNVTYLEDAGSIALGKAVYAKNCKSCHLDGGAGEIGPNLTDKHWLNGGDIKSIFTVVSNGKGGMPKWAGKLKSKEIQQVISYIKTLEGTEPTNGKEAEGELYEE